jgi:hypothetical protein
LFALHVLERGHSLSTFAKSSELTMTPHRLAAVLFVLMSASASTLSGQARNANDALRKLTVDAVALGDTGRAFTELEFVNVPGETWLTTAGFRLGAGALRASYGWGNNQERVYGLGYARPIAQRDLGYFGTLTAGLDAYGAYHTSSFDSYNSRAARLAIPLSIRWGSPSRLSFAPFIAPYAEMGRAGLVSGSCAYSQPSCTDPLRFAPGQTRAAGLGAGAELTLWRIAFDMSFRNVWMRRSAFYSDQFSLGMRVRF